MPLLVASGCSHSRGSRNFGKLEDRGSGKSEEGATAGIKIIHPERRDMKTRVVQPGTIQAFEVTPVYSRISGYVQKYRYNIGDRVKAGDVLIDMWIPDYVEQLAEKSAAVKMAEVQIRVAESLAAGRRGQGGDGQGKNRVGRGRRQAGPGQLYPLGVGVQTARDARHPARARRASSRRDLPSIRRGRRRARPGRRDGL